MWQLNWWCTDPHRTVLWSYHMLGNCEGILCTARLLNAGSSHRFPFSENKARLGWRGQPSALRYSWYLPQVKAEGSHAGWKLESFWEKIVLPFACPRQTCLNWVLSILQFEFYQVFINCRFSQLDWRVYRLRKHHACGFSVFAFNIIIPWLSWNLLCRQDKAGFSSEPNSRARIYWSTSLYPSSLLVYCEV